MDSKLHAIESSGKDVDEAVERGLRELGLETADVEITVLDEGSTGFLGIGTREALVRLEVKTTLQDGVFAPAIAETAGDSTAQGGPFESVAVLERVDVDDAGPGEEELAQEIVERLLSKMDITATTDLRQTTPDDLTGEQRWIVEVQGEDLGLLIGSRGETLNAFQYLTRLMAGHLLHRKPSFIIDVEGYRDRREQALARLAERMANKAIQRQKPISLEPMPPNERRIIHITLRDNDKVFTESSGHGRQRRVRIFPKK